MKLAFSTIGCPSWDFNSVLSTAKDFGYNGIEIRGIEGEMYAPNIKVFDKNNKVKTLSKLKELNIEISCLTSAISIALNKDVDNIISMGKAYIDLAASLGVKYVRFMPSPVPYKDGGDIALAKNIYLMFAMYGKALGVTPLVETNGMFADTLLLKDFIESIPEDNKGVLWDINHPYRYNSESVDTTIANIGEYIKYVHIKDSKMVDSRVKYKLMGQGDLPILECVQKLKSIKYDGYLSLEWVKLWEKDLEEPGIIIPIYADFMKNII